jgi:predicted ATPase/transcriptional regulator with XRE-family HTH domain
MIKRLNRLNGGAAGNPTTDPRCATILDIKGTFWHIVMESTNRPVIFGEWLKIRRKALDLTQVEMAQRAGCSVHALRKIESGERRPSKQLGGLLANSLEIPSEELTTFVKVARGELTLERLPPPVPDHTIGSPHKPSHTPQISKLPVALPPLVGREPELMALGQLLADPQCRMLTIVGPGGIGKTRLAIEVASRHEALFPDGIYFVPLAPLKMYTYLVPAIADALGYAFQGQIEPSIQLLNHLHGKHALLVLDNIEHLLEGVDLLIEILAQSPRVKLLVTSRERLFLQSEWVFEIEGLPVPPIDQIERAEEYSAVTLFIQSARRVQVSFNLPAEERSSVVRICQMVDGMPLGIELAAAWVSVLTCSEIAQEIELSLDFLATSMRDVPERQRSLRAAFDHSWSLLSEDERKVLCRLAIFQGGFDRQAGEHISGATLSSLLALVSKSLVRRAESGRFDLHEVIRQYALSYLSDAPQKENVNDRHSVYYLELLRDREQALKGASQQEAMRELTNELDNLRTAWSWAIKRENFELIGQALRSLGRFYEIGGWLGEGIEQIEPVVKTLRVISEDESCQKVLGMALAQQGLLYFRKGEFNKAQSLFNESIDILRPIGDPATLTDPLVLNGIIMHLNGEIDQALALMEEGLACSRESGDQWRAAYALYNQGYIASLLGHYDEGYEKMMAGLTIWREFGDPQFMALGLNFITPTLLHLGHFDQANAFLNESILICEQAGDRWVKGTAYRFSGLLALKQGNIAEAQSMFNKSLDLFTEYSTGWDIIQSLVYLGDAASAAGDFSEAKRIYQEALSQGMEAKVMPLVMDILIGLSYLLIQDGEYDQAMKLSSYAMHNASSSYEAKDRAAQLLKDAEAQLPEQQLKIISKWVKKQTPESIIFEVVGEEFITPTV